MVDSYPTESWISENLYLGKSRINGVGVFTKALVKEGEVVIVWGGILLSNEEIGTGKGQLHTNVAISEDFWLAAPVEAEKTLDDFMNHSCSPNIWMTDEITLVAKRQIVAGEELTADYAIWINDPAYKMKEVCNCGAANCRKFVTGEDWKRSDVIANNRHHFSPFLNKRIQEYIGTLN